MAMVSTSRSRTVRERLDHPVIDADGHQVNFEPPIEDYVRAIGGARYAVRQSPRDRRVTPDSDDERRNARTTRPVWWVFPTRNTVDRATSALPRLLYERMDELGLDYSVLFPSGMGTQVYRVGSDSKDRADDPELRRVASRAVNAYRADICREFADRMTPAHGIPMHTPEEAIEELEYSVRELGAKAIAISAVRRPIKAIHEKLPSIRDFETHFDGRGSWLDTFGLDSEYDYDPFWRRCVELKVAVMSHGVGLGYTGRSSPTNYMYNHIGHFADAGESLCKSLFMGGVTRRFPSLAFAILEGGASTAARIYCDLIGHWEKRGRVGIENCNPANLDRQLFYDLHARYGGETVEGRLEQVLTNSVAIDEEALGGTELDDFAACSIQRKEDIRDLFVPRFFFGCEADDPLNAVAFNEKLLPMGVRLNAIFASDIGHWDVPEMASVLSEAYEQVEHELMTASDFRDFTFANAARFFAGANPDFFKGTRVETEVERLMTGVT